MEKITNIIMIVFVINSFIVLARSERWGVDVGDSFNYSVDVLFESNDPDMQRPSWIENSLEIEYLSFTLTQVSEESITYNNTYHFRNGTTNTISTTHYIQYSGWFIPANLSRGDILSTRGPYTIYINETIPRTYIESTRDTNHVTYFSYLNVENIEYRNVSFSFFWDKLTGAPVEASFHYINQTTSYVTSWLISYTILNSSLWVVSEFHSFLIIPLFLIVASLLIYWKRRVARK